MSVSVYACERDIMSVCLCVYVCMYVCVCVCVWKKARRNNPGLVKQIEQFSIKFRYV